MRDELVAKIRKMNRKDAQDFLVNQVFLFEDWIDQLEEEIKQYDEISLERDLYKWEKEDYNKDITRMKSYKSILFSWELDLGVRGYEEIGEIK